MSALSILKLLLGGIGLLLFAICCYLLASDMRSTLCFALGFFAQVAGIIMILIGLTSKKQK